MPWNWELTEWPHFHSDFSQIAEIEREFLIGVGGSVAFIKSVGENDYKRFIVDIMSQEGLESSRIEGEILDRESLQSSIRRHFGLDGGRKIERNKEANMAGLLIDLFESFDQPLTDTMLCKWHATLFKGQTHIDDVGRYRTHEDPMQIVSNRTGQVFYQAMPSAMVEGQMSRFIEWFNEKSDSLLGKASIAHLYFESIHPFEDGNGRIGRLLVEKILSQGIGRPVLISLSKVLQGRKKEYYTQLERCNKTLDVQQWVLFFAKCVVEAQQESMEWLNFLIAKSKILTAFAGQLNPRQEKGLLRMFAEGPAGFKGGLSSENYVSITKASRATATRDLADLVEKGILTKTGALRHTRYHLKLSH